MRQLPRLFSFHLCAQMIKMNFAARKSQPTMFVKDKMIVVAYVDDVLVAGNSEDIQEWFAEINQVMKIKRGKDLGFEEPVKFLGSWYLQVEGGYQTWLS